MVSAMRAIGFDYVFDTNFSADVTTLEEAHELLRRLKSGGPFPMVCARVSLRSLFLVYFSISYVPRMRASFLPLSLVCPLVSYKQRTYMPWVPIVCGVRSCARASLVSFHTPTHAHTRTSSRTHTNTVHVVLPRVGQPCGEAIPAVHKELVDVQVPHGHARLPHQERVGTAHGRCANALFDGEERSFANKGNRNALSPIRNSHLFSACFLRTCPRTNGTESPNPPPTILTILV